MPFQIYHKHFLKLYFGKTTVFAQRAPSRPFFVINRFLKINRTHTQLEREQCGEFKWLLFHNLHPQINKNKPLIMKYIF